MGRDKASLPFGDAPLGERLLARLSEVFDDVVVVTNGPGARWEALGARTVADECPGLGPLEGLRSGLAATRHGRALVLACDMPFVTAELLRFLASQVADAEAVVLGGPGGPEPLVGVYSRRLLSRIEAALAGNQRSMRAFLASVALREIPEADWRPFDPKGRALWNLNRPEDYDRALAEGSENGERESEQSP